MKNKNALIAKRRRKMLIRRSIFFGIIIIVGIVIFMLKAPIFNVKTITVKGTLTVDKGIIQKKLESYIGMNIFSISNSEIEKVVNEDPYIKNVSVQKKGINTLELDVIEESVNFYIDGEVKKIISNNGILLEEVDNLGDKYLVKIEGSDIKSVAIGEKIIVDDKSIEALNSLAEIIRNNESSYQINNINLTDIQRISIKINDMEIKIGDYCNLKDKFNKVFNIMDQQGLINKKGYIDISSEEAPVIKVE